MGALVAKPTKYSKYTFRSQLEARWALFFDALGIRYLYEPKLFCLRPNLWYLPDFWLTDHRCFLEIKGAKPQQREKMRMLARKTRVNVYTFFGDVGVPGPSRGTFVDYGDDYYFQPEAQPIRIRYPYGGERKCSDPHLINAYGRWSEGCGWYECVTCGMIVIGSADPTIHWLCACPEPRSAPHTASSRRLLSAYRQAFSHRFVQSDKALTLKAS